MMQARIIINQQVFHFVEFETRSSATAESTAHPSCLVGVLAYKNQRSLGVSSTTFMQWATKATELGEVTQNNGHYAVRGHSRSVRLPILVLIKSTYATSCYI